MAHGEVYVAQTTPAHLNHFYRAVMEANAYPGPAVVIVYSACMPEHGIADDAATRQAKLAVDSRAFPLFTYDPRRGRPTPSGCRLQGNPALRDDWARRRTATPWTSSRSPGPRAASLPTSAATARRRRDPGDPGRSAGELADTAGARPAGPG